MTQFSDLPSSLVIDILSRLPITTLVICICVCKDWIRLFRDPSFIKLHFAASPIHILNRYVGEEEEDGTVFQFGQVSEYLGVKIVNLRAKVNLPPSTKIYGYGCINSCNGLLCLGDGDLDGDGVSSWHRPFARSVWVCNPVLGEWVLISTPVRNYSRCSCTIAALVFSAKNDQYKLLQSFLTEEDYGFEVYTLGATRQWRSIDETLGCRLWQGFGFDLDLNTFLHGSLHWTNDSNTKDFICCFDVENERFRRLSLPSTEGKSSITSHLLLGVINGCLCAVFSKYNNLTDDAEVWAMKEYGVEKSWAKMLTIHEFIPAYPEIMAYGGGGLVIPSFLCSKNEEEIFIYDYPNGLLCYNMKRNRFRRDREKTLKFHFVATCNPSFISLQDVAKGEQVLLSRTMQVIQ